MRTLAVLGNRPRTMGDTTEIGTEVGRNTGKRPRSEAHGLALAVDLGVVKEHAQWWNTELKPQVEAHRSSVAAGVDGAASACVADECNRVLREELPPEDEEQHAELVYAGEIRELDVWKKFDASAP